VDLGHGECCAPTALATSGSAAKTPCPLPEGEGEGEGARPIHAARTERRSAASSVAAAPGRVARDAAAVHAAADDQKIHARVGQTCLPCRQSVQRRPANLAGEARYWMTAAFTMSRIAAR